MKVVLIYQCHGFQSILANSNNLVYLLLCLLLQILSLLLESNLILLILLLSRFYCIRFCQPIIYDCFDVQFFLQFYFLQAHLFHLQISVNFLMHQLVVIQTYFLNFCPIIHMEKHILPCFLLYNNFF